MVFYVGQSQLMCVLHLPVSDIEILNGLKWTQALETKWAQNHQENPDLLWQFFGSQTGIMRNYPGTYGNLTSCQTSYIRHAPNPKTQMFLISSCSRLCPIHWSQVLSWEWRCSWSSTDRRCSNYIWVINSFNAYSGVPYIRGFTVHQER